MTVTHRPTLRHVPALDGLRGLAVAGVVAYHAGLGWMSGGYLGVSAFFTLSGYLITSLLLVEWDATGRVSLSGFWGRRFRRLLPAALAAIGGVVVLAPFFADSGQLADLRGDVVAGLGYVANWRFVLEDRSYGDLFAGPSPLQHLWSLAIEEQFYVVFPLLTAGLLRIGRGRRGLLAAVLAVLTAASVAWSAHLGGTASGITRSYFDTGARAAELLIGALLAVLLAGRPARVERRPRLVGAAGTVALAAIAVAWVVVPQSSPSLRQGGFALHAVLMAVILAAAHVPGPVRSLCSTGALQLAGRVSYGIYLIHWPVFVWVDAARTGIDGPPLLAVRLAITLALTAVSYRFVEQPIRAGQALRGLKGVSGAFAAAALVLFATTAVSVSVPARDQILGTLDSLPAAHTPPAIGDEVVPLRSPATSTEPDAVDVVLLLGDSVMSQAYEQHAAQFAAAGVTTAYAGGPGTGPLSPQGSWGQQLDGWIRSFQPDVVVIEACCNYTIEPEERYVDATGASVAPGSDAVLPAWEVEIRDLVRRAGAGGARVALVRFAPVQSNGYYGEIEEHVDAVNVLYDRLAAEVPDLELIDWGAALAPDGEFTWDVPGPDGAPIRIRLEDGVHLTPAGSDRVAAATVASVLRPSHPQGIDRQP